MQYSQVYTAFIPHTFVGLSLVLIPGDIFLQQQVFVLVQVCGALKDTYASYNYEKLKNLCETVSWNSTTLLDVPLKEPFWQ